MIAIMEDAGFIVGGYILTFAAIGGLAWRYVSTGRKLAEQVPDEEKYWA